MEAAGTLPQEEERGLPPWKDRILMRSMSSTVCNATDCAETSAAHLPFLEEGIPE